MSLEKIINGIKKAACVTLASLAFALGGIKEAKAENLKYEITKVDEISSSERLDDVHINNRGDIIMPEPPALYKDSLKTRLPEGKYLNGINDRGDILAYGGIVYRLGEKIELDFEGYDINNGLNRYTFGLGDFCGNIVGGNYLYTLGSDIKWDLKEMLRAQSFNAFLINDREQIAGKAERIKDGQLVSYLVRYAPFGVFSQSPLTHNRPPELIELEKDPNYPSNWRYMLNSINNDEQIVGGVCVGIYMQEEYACMWDENGKLKRLDTYSYPYSVAYAINDNGQIVGRNHWLEEAPYQAKSYAILWQNGKAINLDELLPENSQFIHLRGACDINNKGQIVGVGKTTENENAVFLMTPKPSPDLNEDGIVNFYDLAILGEHWLEEK